VQRELREGARRPVNHRLRFWSVAVGTLVLWATVANSDKPSDQLGGWLFASLHTLLLGLIFLIVPALAADSIAREKREGTLGLLFLTPLSAGGIVAGKAMVQALRAFTLWLAVLPLLTIPFLTGGITWFDAFSALSLEFCAAVLCLAAGLLASSLARERNTAFLLAFLFAAFFLLLYAQLFQFILLVGYRGFAILNEVGWWRASLETLSIFSGLLEIRGFASWSALASVSTVLGKIWATLCWTGPPVTLLIFYLVARFAARRVERSWQDKVPSLRRESLIRRYCTPLFQRRFRRQMQRSLDWNPIAWLQQYSWKARLGKWGLCLAFLLVEGPARAAPQGVRQSLQMALLLTLAGLCTFVGVSGFLEEKRSGALELILVAPISVNKLIFGRVWGLWKQFLPAGLILAICFSCDEWSRNDFNDAVAVEFILACAFLTLPVFATYFALRVKNLIVAAVLTWVALWLPFILVMEAEQLVLEMYGVTPGFILAIFFSYSAFALLACFLLRHSLSRRIYSF
jgi:ABC-type transport system involved in multi-copper enzyme maturation permease subunit